MEYLFSSIGHNKISYKILSFLKLDLAFRSFDRVEFNNLINVNNLLLSDGKDWFKNVEFLKSDNSDYVKVKCNKYNTISEFDTHSNIVNISHKLFQEYLTAIKNHNRIVFFSINRNDEPFQNTEKLFHTIRKLNPNFRLMVLQKIAFSEEDKFKKLMGKDFHNLTNYEKYINGFDSLNQNYLESFECLAGSYFSRYI